MVYFYSALDTIADYLKLYAVPRKVSWRDDQLMLRRFEAFVDRRAYLQEIDRKTVEQFLLRLLATNVSKPRVNRYTATLKCFFNRWIDWGKLSANPCRGIKLYPESPRTHWLESGQIAALLRSCSNRVRPIVQVALLTALRLGDILQLSWDKIDFEAGVIRIVQNKTNTPLVLPISAELAGVLSGLPKAANCPYVFQDNGCRIERFGWRRADFQKAVVAAGLQGTRMHDLRHTAATHLRRLGCDLPVVQQLLGHKTIRTTLRYAHVHPSELRTAIEKLGQQMMPQPPAYFTITSQSTRETNPSELAKIENDAKRQLNEKRRPSGAGLIPQTVKRNEPPSEKQKETDSPSS